MSRPYPPDDHPDTWHIHEDGSWDWGINCSVCYKGRSFEVQSFSGMVIEELKKQNRDGMTTRELEREALGDRWNDPKVQRAR